MKKGYWIYGEDDYGQDGYFCSKCGYFVRWNYTDDDIDYIKRYNYCPNCGADMREDGKQEIRWIPCDDRLPEDRRIVLVTAYWHETYQVMEASYYGDGLWWCVPFNNCGDHMQKLKPIAWMPLPEPYKRRKNDSN